ncbi:DUF1570 domain-containing protein [Sphingomonas cannabina]|uniref:DUF1570 domain-containing protein n=1 Tax=Sphingomonas cannabina TaxID=2899123 RepID=UPI001F42F6FD|nr:DUF1570 domain-containing protein [Sphingomonas cannabina]UIJ44500.1 DUF1570 domain-containing protein [Sphingomonas cannabina]
MRAWFGALAAGALACAAPAHAEWYEARTDHFVIDIDADEPAAREFAERLERYDAALRRLYGLPDDPATHANPVRIFVLKAGLFTRVCQCGGLAGYYRPRAGGSVIFSLYAPGFDRHAKAGDMTSQVTLLHEYAHHMMYSSEPIAYPVWFSEGFAEFNANVEFRDDGSIVIGLPANYRAGLIRTQGDYLSMPLGEFFTTATASPLVYGRGWLLTHYLMLTPKRQGQLAKYLQLMNRGKPSLDAAGEAFGDVQALWREMFAYFEGRILLPPLGVPPPAKPPHATVTKLSPGVAALMPLRARSVNGARGGLARELARDAAKIAADYPADARVQTEYAEAELVAGHPDLAAAAADRALALAPGSLPAMLAKGQAEVRRLVAAKSTDAAAWTAARAWLIKANHADPNAAAPLLAYFRSFAAAGTEPTPGAVKGLRRAFVLGAEDPQVRIQLARHLFDHDDAPGARTLLQPIAFAPHDDDDKNVAAQVIALIDAGKLAEAKPLMAKMAGTAERN